MYTGIANATANPARQPHMVSRLLVLAWSSLFGTSVFNTESVWHGREHDEGPAWEETS
jgi:hypothetical protein